MTRNMKILAIFLLVLCVSLNKAQAEQIFTWEDCVKEARQNHPDLISAEEELNQAKASKAIDA